MEEKRSSGETFCPLGLRDYVTFLDGSSDSAAPLHELNFWRWRAKDYSFLFFFTSAKKLNIYIYLCHPDKSLQTETVIKKKDLPKKEGRKDAYRIFCFRGQVRSRGWPPEQPGGRDATVNPYRSSGPG